MDNRTVYTWVCPFIGKDGQEHWTDGGPYRNKRNAEVRAMIVTASHIETKGSLNVKPWYIREHTAPVEQQTIEEIFPEMIGAMRKKHAHLFHNEQEPKDASNGTGTERGSDSPKA